MMPLHTKSPTSLATERNLRLATDVLADCFAPARPEEFAKFCPDERGQFMFAAFAAAFPDALFHAAWTVADDRRVVLGGRIEATHRGVWRGVPPTGRRVSVAVVSTLAVLDQRVVDVSFVSDSLAMAEQLGAVAPFEPPACVIYDRKQVQS